MLKKVVKYKDFDGVEKEEELNFHLTKAELIEFVSAYPDDFTKYVQEAINATSKEQLVSLFRAIILKSYGLRQGTKFIKSDTLSEEFSHTEAYSELFVDLFTNTQNMISFFNGVLGVDLDKLAEQVKTESKT